jgi:hypothetical protein
MDGHHRYRVAKNLGLETIQIYDVMEKFTWHIISPMLKHPKHRRYCHGRSRNFSIQFENHI